MRRLFPHQELFTCSLLPRRLRNSPWVLFLRSGRFPPPRAARPQGAPTRGLWTAPPPGTASAGASAESMGLRPVRSPSHPLPTRAPPLIQPIAPPLAPPLAPPTTPPGFPPIAPPLGPPATPLIAPLLILPMTPPGTPPITPPSAPPPATRPQRSASGRKKHSAGTLTLAPQFLGLMPSRAATAAARINMPLSELPAG